MRKAGSTMKDSAYSRACHQDRNAQSALAEEGERVAGSHQALPNGHSHPLLELVTRLASSVG